MRRDIRRSDPPRTAAAPPRTQPCRGRVPRRGVASPRLRVGATSGPGPAARRIGGTPPPEKPRDSARPGPDGRLGDLTPTRLPGRRNGRPGSPRRPPPDQFRGRFSGQIVHREFGDRPRYPFRSAAPATAAPGAGSPGPSSRGARRPRGQRIYRVSAVARPMAPALGRPGEAPGDRADPDRPESSPRSSPTSSWGVHGLVHRDHHEEPYQKYGDSLPEGVQAPARTSNRGRFFPRGNVGRSSFRRLPHSPQEYVSPRSERADFPRIDCQHHLRHPSSQPRSPPRAPDQMTNPQTAMGEKGDGMNGRFRARAACRPRRCLRIRGCRPETAGPAPEACAGPLP